MKSKDDDWGSVFFFIVIVIIFIGMGIYAKISNNRAVESDRIINKNNMKIMANSDRISKEKTEKWLIANKELLPLAKKYMCIPTQSSECLDIDWLYSNDLLCDLDITTIQFYYTNHSKLDGNIKGHGSILGVDFEGKLVSKEEDTSRFYIVCKWHNERILISVHKDSIVFKVDNNLSNSLLRCKYSPDFRQLNIKQVIESSKITLITNEETINTIIY